MARTDNDTWDLASSVGATATMVAAARAMATTAANPLINDPFAEPLVRAVGVDFFTRLVAGELRPEDLDNDSESVGMQRMADSMAMRTKFFDEFFVTATGGGIRQAVILASGLDTRAYRLPWPAGTTVYEIDQPEVIGFKTRTLDDLGAEATAQRRAVAIDLRNDWPSALKEAGFDAGQPTAWSAEGLLVYLPPEAQDRLFDNISELSAPGSRIATEHMDMSGLPADWAEKLTERSKRIGSDINLAELFYTGERNSAAEHLTADGWRVDVLKTVDAFQANGFELPDDELAAFGGDSGYLTATLN